jgi:hypothetical protein
LADHCGAVNRSQVKLGNSACVRCGAVKQIDRPRPLLTAILLIVILGTIGYFAWTAKPSRQSSKQPIVTGPAYTIPTELGPSASPPSNIRQYGQPPAAGLPNGTSNFFDIRQQPK